MATFFVPVPVGSGGFGEIIVPFFTAVLGIPFFLAVMVVLPGVGNLLGLAARWHGRPALIPSPTA